MVLLQVVLLKYLNISSTNYFDIALSNFSFPSFPKSDQTPVLQDKAECASAGQVFNGFGLSGETLTVLLDLQRSATIQTLVFLFCLASGTSYRVVSRVLDMPHSTVIHQAIHLLKTPEHMEAGLGLKLMLFF